MIYFIIYKIHIINVSIIIFSFSIIIFNCNTIFINIFPQKSYKRNLIFKNYYNLYFDSKFFSVFIISKIDDYK